MIKSELISRIAKQNPGLFAIEKAVNTIIDEIAAALVRSENSAASEHSP
jgi:nucleoid DNA-binding protein